MPLQAPLDQFASRLIRNRELHTFIQGLLEMGVTERELLLAMQPECLDQSGIRAWTRQMQATLDSVVQPAHTKV